MFDRTSRTKAVSLRWRLTLLLALATLIILGAAAWIVDWRADSEMQQRFDSVLLARAQAFVELVHVDNGRIEFNPHSDTIGAFPGNANASRYDLRCGKTLIARTPQAPPLIAAGALPHFADARLHDDHELRVVALRFVPSSDDAEAGSPAAAVDCSLRYALDRGPLDEILDSLDWILLGSLFGVCALVLMLTPWLVRRGLRPLSVLASAMAGVGPDAPGRRLPDGGTRELSPLVARFNDVLARMDAGVAREREFAAGLAHELRTRLAELRALVDVETRYPSGRDAHDLLSEAGAIGAELESTVTALLQLTRIESGLEQVQRESVPLAPLLKRAQKRHANAATVRGVCIEIDLPNDPSAAVSADIALLDIVLDNLIGNAVAYAPAGSVVIVQAHPDSIEVVNRAPALRDDDLANFGQRFWRKGEAGGGHAGLGLALAAAAARAQHMQLAFRLEEGALRAMLRWQRNQGETFFRVSSE